MPAKQLDQELIDHACSQLHKVARRHVNNGSGPASAARAAIRETRALFPSDWHLAVQGDDSDEFVEVWEVEHKRTFPCARVRRDLDLPPTLGRRSKKTKTAKSTKRKRRPYSINPSSPDVIKAFMASRQPATEEGIQEFLAKHYGDWMKQSKKRHPEMLADEVWDDIQREFTAALERHFKFKD
jgi:hypothetical protein